MLKLKACFAISSCEMWGPKDKDISHVNFYKHVVEIFEKRARMAQRNPKLVEKVKFFFCSATVALP